MHKSGLALASVAALAALANAAPAAAQAGCDRARLEQMADGYVTGQAAGQLHGHLEFGEWVEYRENGELSSLYSGIVGQKLEFAHHLRLLDEQRCRVFVEGIVLQPKEYVIAMTFNQGFFGVGGLKSVVTDEGDWLFDASATYEYARREDWGIIPEDRRNTREEIVAAADAYLDLFNDKTVEVPWGTPCARLEGGIYTGKGQPDDTCNVGVPEGVPLVDRDYIVDAAKGAVAVFLRFGGPEGRPDVHTFRVEDGKLRYVHTVTNCGEEVNCGFPPLEEMLKNNPDMQPPPVD
jgi:hypothetical protein